nr:lysophospholipid acyltransferase LPEAT2 [Ipomoea trifida]
MSHHTLSTPLLPPATPSDCDAPHTIVAVNDRGAPNLAHQSSNGDGRLGAGLELVDDNPYGFLGAHQFEAPESSTIDPFLNHTAGIEGVYEWVKILVCLPVALIRLALFGICLMIGYVATRIALGGWRDKHNPMPKWRSRLMWVTRISARFILFSFGYQWIKRKGKPAPREIAPIVVSNHISYIDPIFFFYELFPTIVASESHDSMPFVGTIIRAMQVIYVDRFSQSSRKNAVNEIKRKASRDQFPRVLLFPEGTTTNGRSIISFQLGAFIPGFPIQPVVVRYPHVHFDQSWGNISLARLMFRMFTQFHNFMEVEYLPIVSPLENQKENAVHFAMRTSHAIASSLNVVQTSHSYADALLLMKAAESNKENPSLYMTEMAWVKSAFNVSSLEAMDFLDVFLSMNPDSRGQVKIHDFLRVLRLKPCALSQKIFQFVDVQKNGRITFKQFLVASVHILNQPSFSRACELAFEKCDSNRKHYILEQELEESLSLSIPSLSKDEIHDLFNLLDANHDGRISREDFITGLRRNPLLIALFVPKLLNENLSGAEDHVLVEIL